MPPHEVKSERQRRFHHDSDGADSITVTAAFMGSESTPACLILQRQVQVGLEQITGLLAAVFIRDILRLRDHPDTKVWKILIFRAKQRDCGG